MNKNQALVTELKKIKANNLLLIKKLNERNDYVTKVIEILEDDSITLDTNSSPSEIITALDKSQMYPNFPTEESLLEQFKYIEEQYGRFMDSGAFKERLMEALRLVKNKKAMESLAQKLNYYVKKGVLIRVKYSNSNFYTFYTTRKDWIENIRTKSGRRIADIVPGHEPDPDLLTKLSENQKAPENMHWTNI